MESYVKWSIGKMKVGALSEMTGGNDIHKGILNSIDSTGDGKVTFYKLGEDIYREKTKCFKNPAFMGTESYLIEIADEINIYYTSEITKIYALYALKRNYGRDGIKKGVIFNTPKYAFRSYKTNLPAREGIEDYKRFIDMLLAYGHNSVMIELGGAMEYKSHPEINSGWVEYCNLFKDYNGMAEDAARISPFPKNSIHKDNAGGQYLTQEEIKDIITYCRDRHFEIIPEVPCMSHADYLLYPHPEFSEYPEDNPIPNNACPLNEDYNKLVDDILDEVVALFQPKRINICHDEAYVYGHCPRCKGKDPAHLVGDDIVRIHDYLAQYGVETMIWGDRITPTRHGGLGSVHIRKPHDGRYIKIKDKEYPIIGFMCLNDEEWEQAKKENPDVYGWYVAPTLDALDIIPKDIQVMNWCWKVNEKFDYHYTKHGFTNFFGNAHAALMRDFDRRMSGGAQGISFSNWGALDDFSIQMVEGYFALGYNSFACWNHNYDENKMRENVFTVADSLFRYKNYDVLMGRHLEIIHTTDAVLSHPSFQLEYDSLAEDFTLGKYEIEYADGSKEDVPVVWGREIGRQDAYWIRTSDDESVKRENMLKRTEHIYEPIGGCLPILEGFDTWYKMVIPNEKDIKNIIFVPEKEYKVVLKEACVK